MPDTFAKVRFREPVVLAATVVVATTISSTLSPDRDDLSILFDGLRAESQAPQGMLSAATTVMLEIGIEPPSTAHRVRVDLDLRGRLEKSAGSHAVLAIAVGDTVVTRAFELGSVVSSAVNVDLRESMPAHPAGRLVERVLVSAWLAVGRQTAGETALLVVDSLDFTIHAI